MQDIFELKNKKFWKEFGIEIGTLTTFYSRANPELGNVKIIKEEKKEDKENIEVYSEVLISGEREDKAKVEIKDTIEFDEKKLKRKVIFKFSSGSVIRDVVSRYVLDSNLIKKVKINTLDLTHKGRNKYFQYKVDNAEISLFSKKISIVSKKKLPKYLENKFKKLLYFRDEIENNQAVWIFHSRFLVKNPEIVLFKGCCKRYNRPFPLTLNNILWKTGIYKIFLDIREKYSQNIPFQANGGVRILSEVIFVIEDTWTIT